MMERKKKILMLFYDVIKNNQVVVLSSIFLSPSGAPMGFQFHLVFRYALPSFHYSEF
jgi:hypothetical protein